MTCIVVFLQATLMTFLYHMVSQFLDECNVMMVMTTMSLIIVPFIAFRAEEREDFFLSPFSPFCLSFGGLHHT